mmetsp:Transcript_13532/g.20590  ORF Transcript_13532/g.20590 Transcript_13532/m.20590 type:complete len:107 (-) Transcript_13532:614-934(-)
MHLVLHRPRRVLLHHHGRLLLPLFLLYLVDLPFQRPLLLRFFGTASLLLGSVFVGVFLTLGLPTGSTNCPSIFTTGSKRRGCRDKIAYELIILAKGFKSGFVQSIL